MKNTCDNYEFKWFKKIKKNEVVIIGKIGQKKKIEIAKIAKAKKIVIYNLNVEKFLHHQEHTKNFQKQKKVEEEKIIIEKAHPRLWKIKTLT